MRPLAIDLFCKAGGAARGLVAAGYGIIGVDIDPQPNYPFEFLQMDALEALRCVIAGTAPHDFSFIWASPPCQANTALRHAPNAKQHECLIEPTRALLKATGLPYVIENVEGARAKMLDPVMLCGSTFKLGFWIDGEPHSTRYDLRRHRLFEANFPIPNVPCCHDPANATVGVYGGHVRCRASKHGGRGTRDFVGYDKDTLASLALGLPSGSMTMDEYSNAIPPAYAELIGRAALEHAKQLT